MKAVETMFRPSAGNEAETKAMWVRVDTRTLFREGLLSEASRMG